MSVSEAICAVKCPLEVSDGGTSTSKKAEPVALSQQLWILLSPYSLSAQHWLCPSFSLVCSDFM